MAASSYTSNGTEQFQPNHPCDCGLPSRVRTSRTTYNPGKQFRVCHNSLRGNTSKCNFWEWVEPEQKSTEPEQRSTEAFILIISTMENEINILKMKFEQESVAVRQELDKMKWKLFAQKLFVFVIFIVFLFY
ncbi:hypothetical protein OSB04_028156, partial [Centaurea solstitialis]